VSHLRKFPTTELAVVLTTPAARSSKSLWKASSLSDLAASFLGRYTELTEAWHSEWQGGSGEAERVPPILISKIKMKNNRLKRGNRFAFALLVIVILLPQLRTEADELIAPKPPYSAEQLRAWHKAMEPWPWLGQPEQKIHLRNETDCELLMAISGYVRGGTYVLFAEQNGKWFQISDGIEQAHHPPYILQTQKDGWHDFETFVPAWGSGGAEVWIFTYSWNGKKYILKNQKDGKWCDQPPFRTDKSLCPEH
jgi:hypothetical protein